MAKNNTKSKGSGGAGFPRGALIAIIASGYFCALMTVFLTIFAYKAQYHPFFLYLNGAVSLFLFGGSSFLWYALLSPRFARLTPPLPIDNQLDNHTDV
jgi:hypothetical protein